MLLQAIPPLTLRHLYCVRNVCDRLCLRVASFPMLPAPRLPHSPSPVRLLTLLPIVGCHVPASYSAPFRFAAAVLTSVTPTSGFATGCKRVTLFGAGFATLAWVRKVGTSDAAR